MKSIFFQLFSLLFVSTYSGCAEPTRRFGWRSGGHTHTYEHRAACTVYRPAVCVCVDSAHCKSPIPSARGYVDEAADSQ